MYATITAVTMMVCLFQTTFAAHEHEHQNLNDHESRALQEQTARNGPAELHASYCQLLSTFTTCMVCDAMSQWRVHGYITCAVALE